MVTNGFHVWLKDEAILKIKAIAAEKTKRFLLKHFFIFISIRRFLFIKPNCHLGSTNKTAKHFYDLLISHLQLLWKETCSEDWDI